MAAGAEMRRVEAGMVVGSTAANIARCWRAVQVSSCGDERGPGPDAADQRVGSSSDATRRDGYKGCGGVARAGSERRG